MKWQKSPQELIDLFASVMPGPPAVQRKMFGYPAVFINGNMFMGLFQNDMILRLPETQREEFLKKDGAKIFEPMPGRPMREYVAVPSRLLADRKELASWVLRSLAYGSSLKPKSSAKKSKTAGAKPKRYVSSKKNNALKFSSPQESSQRAWDRLRQVRRSLSNHVSLRIRVLTRCC